MNVCPQNRGNVGNASEPSTPASARSSTRAFGLVAPGPHLVVGHRGDVHLRCGSNRERRRRESRRAGSRRGACARRSAGPRTASSRPSGRRRSSPACSAAPTSSVKSPQRARSTRGPCSRIRSGSRSCQRCAGSTTWSSTLMIFGSSAHRVALHVLVRRADRAGRPESNPPCLRMNVVDRRRMRQPSGVRTYSSRYQPSRIACVCWSMNTKCCMPVAAVAVELDHRHVPDELAPRRRLEQRREPLERVRRAERVVLGVGREHLEPPVLDELARERHVPGAERVQLDQVRRPPRLLVHAAPVLRSGPSGAGPGPPGRGSPTSGRRERCYQAGLRAPG